MKKKLARGFTNTSASIAEILRAEPSIASQVVSFVFLRFSFFSRISCVADCARPNSLITSWYRQFISIYSILAAVSGKKTPRIKYDDDNNRRR